MRDVNEVTGQIVDAAFHVHYRLGPELFESVYERLLARSLVKRGLNVELDDCTWSARQTRRVRRAAYPSPEACWLLAVRFETTSHMIRP